MPPIQFDLSQAGTARSPERQHPPRTQSRVRQLQTRPHVEDSASRLWCPAEDRVSRFSTHQTLSNHVVTNVSIPSKSNLPETDTLIRIQQVPSDTTPHGDIDFPIASFGNQTLVVGQHVNSIMWCPRTVRSGASSCPQSLASWCDPDSGTESETQRPRSGAGFGVMFEISYAPNSRSCSSRNLRLASETSFGLSVSSPTRPPNSTDKLAWASRIFC